MDEYSLPQFCARGRATWPIPGAASRAVRGERADWGHVEALSRPGAAGAILRRRLNAPIAGFDTVDIRAARSLETHLFS